MNYSYYYFVFMPLLFILGVTFTFTFFLLKDKYIKNQQERTVESLRALIKSWKH